MGGRPIPPDVAQLFERFDRFARHGVGIVAPFDFALDRELWRWTPNDACLYLTRLRSVPVPITVETATELGDLDGARQATRDLLVPEPSVVAYACASGSFIAGASGERRLIDGIKSAGAPRAVSTAGSLITAAKAVGARRVAVVTPYIDDVTDRLRLFLAESGLEIVSTVGLGLLNHIWKVTYSEVAQSVLSVDRPEVDAVLIGCTNVTTYEVIAPLEKIIRKPIISANQATMWAALDTIGLRAIGDGQRLLRTHTAPLLAERSVG